jgi:hypothetical protein
MAFCNRSAEGWGRPQDILQPVLKGSQQNNLHLLQTREHLPRSLFNTQQIGASRKPGAPNSQQILPPGMRRGPRPASSSSSVEFRRDAPALDHLRQGCRSSRGVSTASATTKAGGCPRTETSFLYRISRHGTSCDGPTSPGRRHPDYVHPAGSCQRTGDVSTNSSWGCMWRTYGRIFGGSPSIEDRTEGLPHFEPAGHGLRRTEMASHTIEVTFVDGLMTVQKGIPSPLRVDPGDDVTWVFTNAAASDSLRIEFHTFLPRNGFPAVTGSGSSPLNSALPPSTGGSIGPVTIASTAASGLYIYSIFLNGQLLHWATPLFTAGSFEANFGGLEVPRT